MARGRPVTSTGRRWICKSVDERGLQVYPSSYALKLAIFELTREGRSADYLEFGLGLVAVSAIVADQDGVATLWGKRAQQVFAGGTWHVMPSGMLEPQITPRDLILREALEELSVPADGFKSLTPSSIVHLPDIGVVQILYRGQLHSRELVALNLEEHSELSWVTTPNEIMPVYAEALALYQASLQQLAA